MTAVRDDDPDDPGPDPDEDSPQKNMDHHKVATR
jgi:hypothetical protein